MNIFVILEFCYFLCTLFNLLKYFIIEMVRSCGVDRLKFLRVLDILNFRANIVITSVRLCVTNTVPFSRFKTVFVCRSVIFGFRSRVI